MIEHTAENDSGLDVLAARLYLADGAARGTPFIAADQPIRDRYLRMAQAATDHFRRFGGSILPPEGDHNA